MRPSRPGIYWVKNNHWIDRTKGETETEWQIAEFSLDHAGRGCWDFIGDECGLGEDKIVAISPEVVPPEER
jgi:hypothetical protein